MQGLDAAQRQYDRYLPEDNRTDAQIEEDALEAKKDRLAWERHNRLSKYVVPAIWEAVNKARLNSITTKGK